MDFTKQLQTWAKSDALQGRIMLIVGIDLLITLYLLLQNNSSFSQGMLIPLGVLLMINIGYGGFLAYARPRHIKSATKLYKEQPQQALQQELKKSLQDNRNYTMFKPIWTGLIFLSLAAYFFLTDAYYQGLALSLAILFLGVLLIDVFLHRHLKPYLALLQQLIKTK